MKILNVIIAFAIGVVSSFVANNLKGDSMNWIYEHLVRGIWPWYVGLVMAMLYLYIRMQYRMNKWLTYHNWAYDKKQFDSLEEKIIYLIDKRLQERKII